MIDSISSPISIVSSDLELCFGLLVVESVAIAGYQLHSLPKHRHILTTPALSDTNGTVSMDNIPKWIKYNFKVSVLGQLKQTAIIICVNKKQ